MKTAYDKIYDIMSTCYNYDSIPPLRYFMCHQSLTDYARGTIEKQYYRARGDIKRQEIVESVKESQVVDKFYARMGFLGALLLVWLIIIIIL